MKAVDGGHHVAVFRAGGGKITFRVSGDGGDFRGIVEVDTLAGGKAVDHEILGIARVFTVTAGHPCQRVAFFCPGEAGVAYLFRASLVHVGVGRDKCRVAVIVFFEAVGDPGVIPENLVSGPEAITLHVA